MGKFNDQQLSASLVSQVLDIVPAMDIKNEEDTVKIMDGNTLMIAVTNPLEDTRNALVSGYMAGIVKGFVKAIDYGVKMEQPKN